MRQHVRENKEVVVNALTLICQEFCRTRSEGETREETAVEALLSHTSSWHAISQRALHCDAYTCNTPVHASRTTRFERFLAPGRRPAKTA